MKVKQGLIVDLFAGGGGASTGIFWELGRHPDIAINHDPMALAMHKANHPTTEHLVENVWHVRPNSIVRGRAVDLLWASPDCTHFSKAKGAAPKRDVNRAKRSRGLAWVILRWARDARPRLILMENVEEWIDWCPVTKDGVADPKRKGETRKRFIRELTKLGYKTHIEPKDKACDHGAPTIRQRLVMVARCDGQAIVVPKATHGRTDGVRDLFAANVKPYRTAAEIIDWSIPCPSIFTRKKELAPATKRRIARGMVRFVIDNAKPFIVPITRHGDLRVHSIDEPLRTVTTANRGELTLARPYLVGTAHGEGQGRGVAEWPLDRPFGTVTCSGDRALVSAFMARCDQSSAADRNGIHDMGQPVRTITTSGVGGIVEAFLAGCGGRAAQSPPRSVHAPMGTITAKADQILVAPFITKFRADNPGSAMTSPMPTVTANSYVKRPGGAVPLGIAAAFMAKHYGGHETPGQALTSPLSTITTQDHHHLVAAAMVKFKGTCADGQAVTGPLHTIQTSGNRGGGHYGLTQAFLTKYYSEGFPSAPVTDPMHTVTAKPRFSLVTTSAGTFPMTEEELAGAKRVARFMKGFANDNRFDGETLVCAAGVPIVDIGMRMLDLRELYRAQGFPDDYVIAPKVYRIVRGKLVYGPLPKTDGTRMCGNSVSPYQARAWVRANAPPEFYAPGAFEERKAA